MTATRPRTPKAAPPEGAAFGHEMTDERADAVRALEASFSEVMTVFRRHVSALAERVSPGMLPGTAKVLAAVERSGPLTLSALAERLTADKGLVSRSISELEELGLVARTPDPTDRRSRTIAVTPLGAQRLASAHAPREGRLFSVIEDWPLEDVRHLATLLSALAEGVARAG